MLICLLIVFLLTVGYLLFFRLPNFDAAREGELGFRVTTAYLVLVALAAIVAVSLSVLAPGKAAANARRMQFTGVSVAVPSAAGEAAKVQLTGETIDADSNVRQGFRWYALPPESRIAVWPEAVQGDHITGYRASVVGEPGLVRLNGKCVNRPLFGWIVEGAKGGYVLSRRTADKTDDFTEFSLETDGAQVRATSEYDRDTEWMTVKRWTSLRDLLRGCHADGLNRKLARLVTPRGQSVQDRLLVVREWSTDEQGDNDRNAVGLVELEPIDPDRQLAPENSKDGPVTFVQALRKKGSSFAEDDAGPVPMRGNGFRMVLAGPGVGRHAIRLPDTVVHQDGTRLEFHFDPPRSYPLPSAQVVKKAKGKLQISSADFGAMRSGYLLDTGNVNEPYIDVATFREDGRPTAIGKQTVVPNQERRLGDASVAPLYRLSDPFDGRGIASLWPFLGVLVGLGLLVFALRNESEVGLLRTPDSLEGFFMAFVVWGISTIAVAVRYVVALRTSLLPPDNLDSVDAASFLGTYPRATTALFLFPILVAIAILVGLRLSPVASAKRLEGKAANRPSAIAANPYGYLGHAAYLVAIVLLIVTHFSDTSFSLIAEGFILLGVLLRGLGSDEVENEPSDNLQWRLREAGAKVSKRLGEVSVRHRPAEATRTAESGSSVAVLPKPVAEEREGRRNPVVAERLKAFGQYLFSPRTRLFWAVLLLLIADPGTFLFVVPLLLAIAVGAAYKLRPTVNPWVGRGFAILLLLLVISLPFASRVGGAVLGSPVVGRLVKESRLAFAYRSAAVDAPYLESLLLDPKVDGGAFRAPSVMRTLEQRWQMLSYVKQPSGYFGAPMSASGMPYGAMLSDGAFSVFLVGEHGRLVGILYTGLLLLLAAAVFLAAWRAATTPGHTLHMRGLYAIGGVIAFSALYMALGNLWAIPFTGQNMPFLGLNSRQELLLTGAIMLSAGLLCALPTVSRTMTPQMQPTDDGERRVIRLTAQGVGSKRGSDTKRLDAVLWWAFPATLLAGFCFFVVRMVMVSGPADASFDLRAETKEYLKHRLQSAESELRYAKSKGDKSPTIAETPTATGSSPYVRSLFMAYGGLGQRTPFFPRRGVLSDPEFNDRYYLLQSPFRRNEGVQWHGSLLARSSGAKHLIYIGGSRRPWVLDPSATPKTYRLFSTEDRRRELRGQSIGIEVDGSYGGPFLGPDGKPYFRWSERLKRGRVLVGSQPWDAKEKNIPLIPGQVISFVYPSQDGVSRRLSLHYAGQAESGVALTYWRNGRFTRVFPQGVDLPMARSIGEVADVMVSGKKLKDEQNVPLSLDLRLQGRLMQTLHDWSLAHGRPLTKGVRSPDGTVFTALAVLETGTGRVLALPSLPQRDPNEDLDEVVRDFPSDWDARIASSSTWALVNRTVGSSIKPLTFAAVNSQLQGSGFDLTKLAVNEGAADSTELDRSNGEMRHAYRQLGDLHLKRGREIGRDQPYGNPVDMLTYLTKSRTWPAVVTGTIGLVPSANQPKERDARLRRLLAGPANGFISFGGRPVGFRPKTALTGLWVSGQPGMADPNKLADTALFRGIEDCYGPSVAPFYVAESQRWSDDMESDFLSPLDLHTTDDVGLRQRVLPEPHWADATLTRSMDGQLMQYMFGGGECRWNATAMAANMARIASGLRIQPTLQADAQQTTKPMPAPISDSAWRLAHIVTPLMAITTLDHATSVRAQANSNGFQIMMKTGTIDDGAGMESEMLMMTIGPFTPGKGFDPKRSLSAFLSIRSSKRADGRDYMKGELSERVVRVMSEYLREKFDEKKP